VWREIGAASQRNGGLSAGSFGLAQAACTTRVSPSAHLRPVLYEQTKKRLATQLRLPARRASRMITTAARETPGDAAPGQWQDLTPNHTAKRKCALANSGDRRCCEFAHRQKAYRNARIRL
jgi:hypothetical protein